MGVPKLFKFLKTKSRESFIDEYSGNVDILAIDMNAELYPIAEKVFFGETNYKKGDIITIFIEKLILRLERIIERYRPKTLVIAFDGPAPAAKMLQQKSRRIQHEDSINNKYGWTNANFSPGTEVMEEISIGLKEYLGKIKEKVGKIIYSSHRVPGEGEQKIFNYLRRKKETKEIDKETKIMVTGNDADLIVLSLLSKLNITILREDRGEVIFVKAKMLKNKIRELFVSVENFALCTFFIGNDFIGPVAGFYDLSKSLSFMSDIIRRENLKVTSKGGDINWQNLILFIRKLVDNNAIKYIKSEFDEIAETINEHDRMQEQYDAIVSAEYIESFRRKVFDYDEMISEISNNWFTMMNWIYNYYKGNDVNPLLQTTTYFPATLTILSKSQNNSEKWLSNSLFKFKYLTPVKTLISILPFWNLNIISKDIKNFVMNELPDLFPLTVSKTFTGASDLFMGHVHVPLLPYNRLITLPRLGLLDEFENEKEIKNSIQLIRSPFDIPNIDCEMNRIEEKMKDKGKYSRWKFYSCVEFIDTFNIDDISFSKIYDFIDELRDIFPLKRFHFSEPKSDHLYISFENIIPETRPVKSLFVLSSTGDESKVFYSGTLLFIPGYIPNKFLLYTDMKSKINYDMSNLYSKQCILFNSYFNYDILSMVQIISTPGEYAITEIKEILPEDKREQLFNLVRQHTETDARARNVVSELEELFSLDEKNIYDYPITYDLISDFI